MVLTTFVAFKFFAEVVGVISMACLVTGYVSKRPQLFVAWRIASLLWPLSLMVTTDLAIPPSAFEMFPFSEAVKGN